MSDVGLEVAEEGKTGHVNQIVDWFRAWSLLVYRCGCVSIKKGFTPQTQSVISK